jgi:ssDNA-binding Zn-finger/Zn-ribbon topoisomerase 1
MFCPKCGIQLRVQLSAHGRRELCCLPGNMCLSQDLQARFEQRYGAAAADSARPTRSSVLVPPQVYGSLHWYCPGDGIPLNAELECPQCGKHLRDMVYDLVELHPHRPVTQHDEHPQGS